jgi:hypothetical protein
MLGFRAQQRRILLQMQFNLCLSIVNYLLISMQQKVIKAIAKYFTNMGIPFDSSSKEE